MAKQVRPIVCAETSPPPNVCIEFDPIDRLYAEKKEKIQLPGGLNVFHNVNY